MMCFLLCVFYDCHHATSGSRLAMGLTMNDMASLSRRDLLEVSAVSVVFGLTASPVSAKRPACGDVDSCREQGDKKFNEAEKGLLIPESQGQLTKLRAEMVAMVCLLQRRVR